MCLSKERNEKILENKNIVIITGNFFFPNKNAAGKYNLAYGLMLRDIGYRVIFIGTNEEVNYSDNILDTYEEAYGMESYSMPYPSKWVDWGRYKSQFNRVLKVINYYGQENINAIIGFSSPSIALWVKLLWKWAKQQDIPYIAHCAENVRFTKRNYIYSIIRGIDEIYNKKIIVPRADGVIVGGPLLKEYFEKRHCNTIVFPTMADTDIYKSQIKEVLSSDLYSNADVVRNKRFIYVGIPFDLKSRNKRKYFKDRIDKTVELFYKVYKNNNWFIFDIYGLSKNDYLKHVPEHQKILDELDKNVFFHGKIRFESAVKEIISSDFYIFHRDKTYITQSAFPTKASEPISLGVPLITNDTSYIFDYVIDGQTGIVINDVNEVEKVINLLNLTNEEVLKLRKNCLSVNTFDYRKSTSKFKDYLETIEANFKITK